ncbi:MAG: excinuclease ABC subunit UvrA, partial [Acidimicrobiales bacterium]
MKGAREHNLRDVSLELPRDRLIVFTGLSGSGKSSLAFDTIYAEGQRRYVESLSSYARQFLGQMDKPDVDFIEGLSPAISIDQKSSSRNPRSTVGTITEVYDYLRLLYARIGKPHCPTCGRPVARQSAQQIVDQVKALPEGTRFEVLAPVVRGRKGTYEGLLEQLGKQGYARARVDGQLVELSGAAVSGLELKRYEAHTVQVVVDRLVSREGLDRRLTDSIETALGLAEGVAEIAVVSRGGTGRGSEGGAERIEEELLTFSETLACSECGTSFEEMSPRSFSFNSPYGACPHCSGLGTRYEVDPDMVVPDPSLSLAKGALAPFAGPRGDYFYRLVQALATEVGIDLATAWEKLKASHIKMVLYGAKDRELEISYGGRYGRRKAYKVRYEGVVPYLERRHSEADSDFSREQVEAFMREVPCPVCHGARLRAESLAVTVGGMSIFELCELSIAKCDEALGSLQLSERDTMVAERVLKEIRARVRFLLDVGLDYLTLNRGAATLAGGEAQRIRLASQIGSGLVGVLYVLDEPSIGLHQRDNHRLIETLTRLRDLGNTVLFVEHDEDTIRAADHVVDIGPGAGEHGGEVVASGSVADIEAAPRSLTGDYLAGRRSVPVPRSRRQPGRGMLTVKGAAEHNLAGIDVTLPLGTMVAVTGVSGSGKSTLVNDIIHKALMRQVYRSRAVPGRHGGIEGAALLDKVIA